MPKLPKVPTNKAVKSRVKPDEQARRIAYFLEHRQDEKSSSARNGWQFARSVREWMEEEPDHRDAYIKWYEKR